ncbi:MAG: hypothetical protein AAB428_01540 [Patescibacteria group bacterium]
MFIEIDNWMFSHVFGKSAHWFQMLTGRTNFWLAKWFCITGYSSLSAAWMFTGEVFPIGFLCTNILWGIMIASVLVYQIEKFEARCNRSPGFINEARYLRCSPRVLFLCLTPAMFPLLLLLFLLFGGVTACFLIVVYAVGAVSTEYFLACTPLPPGTSKLRQLLNRTLWKLNEWLVPPPELKPNP